MKTLRENEIEAQLKVCKICGRKFLPVFGDRQILCSQSCSGKWANKTRRFVGRSRTPRYIEEFEVIKK